MTAEFAVHSDASTGKCRYTHALIESDEAAFKAISRYVDAKAVVVTNVFRDQLDRYGEVTHTLDNIRIGIEHSSKNAVLCVNADDSLCASLHDDAAESRRLLSALIRRSITTGCEELSDAPYCIRCKHEYVYDYVTYGHLGGYRCPHCGYHRPQPQVHVTKVLSTGRRSTPRSIFAGKRKAGIRQASTCQAATISITPVPAWRLRACYGAGYGRWRQSRFPALPAASGAWRSSRSSDADVRMILIKNPAGCNQVLNFLTQRTEPFVFAACLNDRAQDGKDVSWIWDVDFERLMAMEDKFSRDIYVSGVRADDMALRFLYAGFPKEQHSCAEGLRAAHGRSDGQKASGFRHADLYRDAGAARHDQPSATAIKEFWQ